MKKFMLIFALVGLTLTVSCTPEALATDEVQIDKKDYVPPPNG